MPAPCVNYVIQLKSECGSWFDFDEHPVKLTAEKHFKDYQKKIPKERPIRFVQRTEITLGIRELGA